MNSCLTCKWMSEPNEAHKWHWCEWPVQKLPKAIAYSTKAAISVVHPFKDCETWEPRDENA